MQRSLRLALVLLALAACSRRESAESRAHVARSPSSERPSQPSTLDERRDERARLGDHIARRGIESELVLSAMRKVPRHAFVPDAWSENAYEDRPLPIGHGQTISQPTVVAAMTEAVLPKRTDKCLEIGTGSGYQAAVLAMMGAKVYTIEINKELGERTKNVLEKLSFKDVKMKIADGFYGWPDAAPFDAILITCATPEIP